MLETVAAAKGMYTLITAGGIWMFPKENRPATST